MDRDARARRRERHDDGSRGAARAENRRADVLQPLLLERSEKTGGIRVAADPSPVDHVQRVHGADAARLPFRGCLSIMAARAAGPARSGAPSSY